MLEATFPLNLALFELINASGDANPLTVLIAMGLAEGSPWVVGAVLIWYWLFRTPEDRRALMTAGVALGVGLAANFTLAFLLYVPRPNELGIGTSLLAHTPETSFPSDHATFLWSLAFALVLTQPLRRLGAAIACLGLAVAWARIYLGVHFPLDMAASFVISVGASLVAKGVSGRLENVVYRPVEAFNDRVVRGIFRR